MCLIDLSDLHTPIPLQISYVDKIVHFFFYAILSFLWGMSLLYKQQNPFFHRYFILIGCISFGILIEMIQGTSSFNRSFEWLDIVANTFGTILGFIICLKILTFKPHNT